MRATSARPSATARCCSRSRSRSPPGSSRSSRRACCRWCPATSSYVTGLVGADLDRTRRDAAGCCSGALLFVLGFTRRVRLVRRCCSAASARLLLEHADVLTRVLGVVTIVLGLAFLGLVPLAAARRARPPAARRAGWSARRCSAWCSASAGRRASARRWRGPRARRSPRRTAAPRRAARRSPTASASGCRSCWSALAFRRALGALGFVQRHYRAVMTDSAAACWSSSACCWSPASWSDARRRSCSGWVSGFGTVL